MNDSEIFIPVIFLAFANDKVDKALYLRNLSAESHGINEALKAAAQSGLCEIVEKSSASVENIMDVFTDTRYASRISIFHYGGHADGFSLLLEGIDGSKTPTHKDGLVPFLARQENLKLIFLNGCSSEGQASDLLAGGIPAVIGTTSSINDQVATGLANRFYSSLGDGASIEKSWADATDEVKIEHGTTDTRALYWEGKKETNHHFPWVIQFKPGAEKIKSWNLPDISGNPLYGLPPIPTTFNLPESPFLYLQRYERKHAEIFFGRSKYIRSLYFAVRDEQAPPIILLYGQSGVGKSSLLEAGLQPRLEKSHQILYLRRNGQIGLQKTLYYALLEALGLPPKTRTQYKVSPSKTELLLDLLNNLDHELQEKFKHEIEILVNRITLSSNKSKNKNQEKNAIPNSIKEAWKLLEEKFNKPILVILDQVEEAYTRPNNNLGNEVNDLFTELKNTFGNPNDLPHGKILLSFRKEYHPEIEEYCKRYELPRSRIFIEPITEEDVIEVFSGFKKNARLKTRYNLQIEDGLPEIIATDIAADKDSPIAPLLQILLTKMWESAKTKNQEALEFDHKLYRNLKEKGLAMDEFLQSQLHEVTKKMSLEFREGLVYDVLRFYCTPNATAAARTENELKENYPLAMEAVKKVLVECKEHFLITDLGGDEKTAMLAHDTLAKSVIKVQLRSTFPLQQAKRVLASKMETIKGGSESSTLDDWELKLIDSVARYFPNLTPDELKLLDDSRKVLFKKEKDKKNWAYFKTGISLASVIGLLWVYTLRVKSDLLQQVSSINHLAASAVTNLETDPTQAYQQAIEGYEKSKILDKNNFLGIAKFLGIGQELKEAKENAFTEIEKALSHTYYNSVIYESFPQYATLHDSTFNINSIIELRDQKLMIPFYKSDTLTILDFNGNKKGILRSVSNAKENEEEEQSTNFTKVKWSHDGLNIITLNDDSILQIFDHKGDSVNYMIGQEYRSFDVSRDGKIMANSIKTINGIKQGIVRLFDTQGNSIDSFNISSRTSQIGLTTDQQNLICIENTLDSLTRLQVINIDSKDQFSIGPAPGKGKFLKIATSNKLIAVATTTGITVWDIKGNKINNILSRNFDPSLEVYDMVFHPISDSTMVICTRDKSAHIYNVYDPDNTIPLNHEITVTSARFSDNGEMILTCSGDNTASIWDLSGKLLYDLKGHDNDVTNGFFIENDRRLITSSLDGKILQWNLNEFQIEKLSGHLGAVNYISLNSTKNRIVSSGADSSVRIWDLKSKTQQDSFGFTNQETRYVSFIDTNNIVGFNSNDAFIYNIPNKKIVSFKDEGHRDSIEWLEVFKDRVVSVGQDSSLIFWDKLSGKPIKKITSPYGKLWDLDISHSLNLVAVGTDTGKIILYNYEGEFVNTLEEHSEAVNYIDISGNGLHMVSASQDGTAIVWDMNLQQKKARLKDIGCAVYNICEVISANFSNDGKMVVTASSDRSVRIWDLKGNVLAHMEGHSDPIVDAYFSHDDDMVYSFSKDKTVRLWSLKGEEIASISHVVNVNSATLDEDHIYSATEEGSILIWLTSSGVYHKNLEKKSGGKVADY